MVTNSRLISLASTAAIALSLGLTGATIQASDSIAISNPSFQNGANPFPGYGAISGWTENNSFAGTNSNAYPFAAGTNLPDANQVAFLQNGSAGTYTSISQSISGLTPGDQYWFQVFYNARQTYGSPGLLATYGSQTIANVGPIPVSNSNFTFLNATFTPTSSSGTLTIENPASYGSYGDNTLLIDSVSVIQRNPGQIVIANPSFEGSTNETWVYPGYLSNIGGWATTGNTGVNTGNGPFADNGTIPDGSQVGFLQNNSTATAQASMSQTLSGLTVGSTYQLKFYYNARSQGGTAPNSAMTVTLGSSTLANNLTVAPVGGTNPYDVFTADYTATASTALLDVMNSTPFGGTAADNTLLVDNFSLAPVTATPEPASLALLGLSGAGLLLLKRRRTA